MSFVFIQLFLGVHDVDCGAKEEVETRFLDGRAAREEARPPGDGDGISGLRQNRSQAPSRSKEPSKIELVS